MDAVASGAGLLLNRRLICSLLLSDDPGPATRNNFCQDVQGGAV